MNGRRLYKSQNDRKLFGVCGGVAQFLRIDATLVRIGVVILTIFTGIPALIYVLMAMIMPTEPRWGELDDPYDMYASGKRVYREPHDLDAQLEHLEKRALVQEVQRLREELLKYKGV
ncbi:PspC domain-containing protein [Brevibacillus sp. TJ4]|uniref:PspC domain-containing protein n=1 Tax=Brevibacillus sp. TJ4 TaxID=3234853 RepID=UPI0037D3D6CA